MSYKLHCRNCGDYVVGFDEAKAAIQAEYNFTDAEFDNDQIIVKVWHRDCAIADGRVDSEHELENQSFYWEARPQRI